MLSGCDDVDVVVQCGDEVAGAGSWKEGVKRTGTSIDKRIFIQIRVCMWEGKVMASRSKILL